MIVGKHAVNGYSHPYALFYPFGATTESEIAEKAPLLIVLHGYGGNYKGYVEYAELLASFGFIVFVPNMSSMNGLLKSTRHAKRQKNIEAINEHLKWLIGRSETATDSLFGKIDTSKVALAGHSAGGAVAFEAACIVQNDTSSPQVQVKAIVFLDGVPWLSTIKRAQRGELKRLALESFSGKGVIEPDKTYVFNLRCGKSSLNAQGIVLELMATLAEQQEDARKAFLDVLVERAYHGDFIDESKAKSVVANLLPFKIFSTKENRVFIKALSAAFLITLFNMDIDRGDVKSKLIPQLDLDNSDEVTAHNLFSSAINKAKESKSIESNLLTRNDIPVTKESSLPYYLR
mmetsp:Transcript_9061/g.10402  ORF Transcript_9061/g.10402 Transcript_9061/m.10402 type:complete len:346 (+) Transcript_9061:3-1040(+)